MRLGESKESLSTNAACERTRVEYDLVLTQALIDKRAATVFKATREQFTICAHIVRQTITFTQVDVETTAIKADKLVFAKAIHHPRSEQ